MEPEGPFDDITIKQEPIYGYNDGTFPEPDVSMEELDGKTDMTFKLQKHELESLIRANDPSITARDPTKFKNHMWKQFKILYYNHIRQDFIRCMHCGVVLSYKKKTGTASLVRHRCNIRAPSKSPQHNVQATYSPSLSADATTEAEHANRQQAMTSALVSLMPHFLASTGLRGGESKIIPPGDLAHFATAQIKFAARDLLPLAFFQQPGFHEFAQILLNIGAEYGHQNIEGILMMPQDLAANHMQGVMERMKQEIKGVLAGNDICLCLDLWRHREEMCLSIETFLIDENFILTRYNLGARILTECTPKHIRVIVQEILSEFLDSVQIDGIKMVVRMEDTVIREAFPSASVMNCMCEVLIKILDELLDEFPTFLKAIDDLSQHLMQHGATTFADLLDARHHSRWQRYFRLLKAIANFSETYDSEEDIFQHYFNEKLETIIQILDFLEPFQQCLDSLRKDCNPTMNEVYLWNKKFQQSSRILPKNGDFVGRIKGSACTLLKKHFVTSKYDKIGLFLDPNFKNMRFMHEDEKNDILDVVRQELESVMGASANDSLSGEKKSIKMNLSDPVPGTSNSSFMNFMEFMDNSVSEEPIETEIKTYMDIRLTEPVDVLSFWKGFNQCPSLKKLARRVLNIPASASRSRSILSPDSIYVSEKIQNLPRDEMIPLLFLRQNTGLH
uniref:Putative atp-binding cassette transporter n=1 Tax=Nyssomyia neivai TaxID=330878 RepID=A0A1L8DF98_9DIPT